MKKHTFEEITKFDIGETYYESGYYGNIHFEIISKPKVSYVDDLDSRQVSFQSICIDSERVIDYLFTESMMHYSPSIYNYPAYVNNLN